MRNFSQNVITLIAQEEVYAYYLVEIIHPTFTIRDTSCQYDITIPGIGTFSASSNLLIVEPPKLSSAVDRELYKLTYIDPLFEKRAKFEAGMTGSKITIHVCFANTLDIPLAGKNKGEILTDVLDMIIAYKGVVDTQGYGIEPDNGTVFAVLECSSPMAALNLTRALYTSKEEMSHINASDTCFDQVSINAQKATYLWGKA